MALKGCCNKCGLLLEENYESCPRCGESLVDPELKRLRELDQAVIEFVSLSYSRANKELAAWRKTLKYLVDQKLYADYQKAMKEVKDGKTVLLSHVKIFRLNEK